MSDMTHDQMVVAGHSADQPPVYRTNRLITADLNPVIMAIVAGSYIAMIATFWLGFVGPSETFQAMAVVTIVLIAFLGIPSLLAHTGRRFMERHGLVDRPRHPLHEFLRGHFQTFTEMIPGYEAAVQVATIPISLLLAAIGITIAYVAIG